MKIIKDMKVGDIYLNPLIQDLWILRKEYIEDLENDNEKWVLALINDDYTEDFEAVANFVKLGNIYELLQEIQQLKDKLKGVQEERDYLFNKQSIENKYLTKENKQLKIDYELYKDNCVYRNYEVEKKDITIKQLKEVIEEVRGVAQELKLHYQQSPTMIPSVKLNKLLQILDKVKGEKND